MAFSIIIDVFLISRVLVVRLHGYKNKAFIVKGLYKTGHIITAAGIIHGFDLLWIVIKLRDHIETSILLLGCGLFFWILL